MKVLLGVVLTIAALVVIGVAFTYSGFYNVSALNPPGATERWFFSTVADNSVEYHANGIAVPALEDAALVDSGYVSFNRSCAGCHGKPGEKSEGRRTGFSPEPPNLSEGVSDLSDAEIFWVVKNGIKMTAMPAFGVHLDDDQLWEIVSFVHLLPKMSPEQYQEYMNRLGGEER